MFQRLVKSSPIASASRQAVLFEAIARPAAGNFSLGCYVLLLLAFFGSAGSAAAENPYDLFARTIAPFTKVLSSDASNRGASLSLVCTVLRDNASSGSAGSPLPGQPPSPVAIEAIIQNPDKLLLRIPFETGTLTLCRNGQQLWGAPGDLVQRLAQQFSLNLNAPGQELLPPLQLPFNEKQLVLLPAFFKVADAGVRAELRVLDVTLMPELAKNIPPFRARLWTGKILSRVELTIAGQNFSCRIERLDFSQALPETTWQHPETAVSISPSALQELIRRYPPAATPLW